MKRLILFLVSAMIAAPGYAGGYMCQPYHLFFSKADVVGKQWADQGLPYTVPHGHYLRVGTLDFHSKDRVPNKPNRVFFKLTDPSGTVFNWHTLNGPEGPITFPIADVVEGGWTINARLSNVSGVGQHLSGTIVGELCRH